MTAAARRSPAQVSFTRGWDEALSRRLLAGADAVLVPSRFEPCGLVQLEAQRYGALPIAHRTGGLQDTIADGRSGVLFAPLAADALVEAAFFHVYGNLFSLYIADKQAAQTQAAAVSDPRELPVVREALASIDKGGYAEACARAACLVRWHGDVPLSRLEKGRQMMIDYKEYLPPLELGEWRRLLGEQEIIVTYQPDAAIASLPTLLRRREERERLLTLLERLENDARVQRDGVTPEQQAMLERVRRALGTPAALENAA